MSQKLAINKLGVFSNAFSHSPNQDSTEFAKMSQEAQEMVVSALLGEFDDSGPPEMSESVKTEIEEWISEG